MVPDKKLPIRVRTWSRRQLEEIISITVAAVRAYINPKNETEFMRQSWTFLMAQVIILHCTRIIHSLFLGIYIFLRDADFFRPKEDICPWIIVSIRMTKFNGWQNGLPSESAVVLWPHWEKIEYFVSRLFLHIPLNLNFLGAFRHWVLIFTDPVWKI